MCALFKVNLVKSLLFCSSYLLFPFILSLKNSKIEREREITPTMNILPLADNTQI